MDVYQLHDVKALQIEVRYPVYFKAEQINQLELPDCKVPKFQEAQRKFETTFAAIVQNVGAFLNI